MKNMTLNKNKNKKKLGPQKTCGFRFIQLLQFTITTTTVKVSNPKYKTPCDLKKKQKKSKKKKYEKKKAE